MTAPRGHVPRTTALVGIAGVSALGTVLSRVTGLGRTIFQASALGASGVSDAYNLANTTPNAIYDLVLGGILAGTLVPVFVRALNDDEERGWEAISAVCTTIAAVLAAATALFLLGVPWIIRLYTNGSHGPSSGAERHLAVTLLYLFVPQLLMYGIAAVATAILAARRQYAYAMYTPILNNLIVIGTLVAFGIVVAHPSVASVRRDTGAVLLLGLGTTAGVIVMAVALVPALMRTGARLRFVWQPGHPAVRTILRLSAWTAGVVVSNHVTLLVVIVLTNRTAGDFTAWQYAYQFFQLPFAIWMVSLIGPMETEISHAWPDRTAARRHLTETIWAGMVLIVPAALGYAALARPVISLVLLHGNMTVHGARLTADTLAAFALGLPFFSVYAAFMRTYQAMQDTRTMFAVYAFENAVNVVLAFLVYPRFGVVGLAATWGVSYAAGAVVAGWHLSRRMNGIGERRIISALGFVIVAGAAAAGVGWVTSTLLAHLPYGTRQLGVALRVVLAVGAAVGVYFLAARVLEFDRIRSKLLG